MLDDVLHTYITLSFEQQMPCLPIMKALQRKGRWQLDICEKLTDVMWLNNVRKGQIQMIIDNRFGCWKLDKWEEGIAFVVLIINTGRHYSVSNIIDISIITILLSQTYDVNLNFKNMYATQRMLLICGTALKLWFKMQYKSSLDHCQRNWILDALTNNPKGLQIYDAQNTFSIKQRQQSISASYVTWFTLSNNCRTTMMR